MAAPTFVAEYENPDWDSTASPKTVDITTAVGDVLAIPATIENNSAINLGSGGTPTYTNFENLSPGASNCRVRIDATTAGITAQTYTYSQTANDGRRWGFNALRFSGSDGIGAAESGSGSGGPTLNITTTQDNSALVVIVGDWGAVDGTSRTWLTVNGFTPTAGNGQEVSYFRNGSIYTVYAACYPDAGAIGSKTIGLSAPGGQTYTIAVIEVKGGAGVPEPATSRGAGRLLLTHFR